MMAITTSNSINVKAAGRQNKFPTAILSCRILFFITIPDCAASGQRDGRAVGPACYKNVMTQKSWMLVALMLALAVAYAVYFTNWFKPATIKIYDLARPLGAAMQRRRDAPPPPLTFGLEGSYRLTEIKAVSLAAWQTNHNVLPVWHLISASNSVPVKFFRYGQSIRGMKPAIPGTRPEPLQTNVAYRLFVSAGRAGGWHDFEIGGSLPEGK